MRWYKICHNVLATKASPFRAKICDYIVCPQSLNKTHSLDYMSVRCPSVVAFSRTFQIWWANKTGQTLTLSDSKILYGVFNNTQHKYSINYRLLSNCKILDILQLPKRRKDLT